MHLCNTLVSHMCGYTTDLKQQTWNQIYYPNFHAIHLQTVPVFHSIPTFESRH